MLFIACANSDDGSDNDTNGTDSDTNLTTDATHSSDSDSLSGDSSPGIDIGADSSSGTDDVGSNTATNSSVDTNCDGRRAQKAAQCNKVCEPLVPNDCDCRGCCLLEGDYRFIGTPGCSLANLASCDPCTPVPCCENPCGKSELCIGQTALDPECLTAVDTDPTRDSDSNADTASSLDTDSLTDTNSTIDTATSDDPVYLRGP
ncbi:MAG: hypothetical protein JXR76_01345 [Deltaproteobacteria bacterium]|nr:hypothetical protein [Deltaproteobacteria bacterium]